MKLEHEHQYICECENWEEPVLYPVAELIQCKECKYADDMPIADGRYWCSYYNGYFSFCSEAKRKEE